MVVYGLAAIGRLPGQVTTPGDRRDIKKDALIIFVGACGGLVIESWGTQTHLWNYYTLERPPLWIIPAWPIASL